MANNTGTPASDWLILSPPDEVRAQLARQKWAVDRRNREELQSIYASDCMLILKNQGTDELYRVGGRDAIIAHIASGWAANTTWMPGSMVHHIGTVLIEPAANQMIRCRSYATYVHILSTGQTEIQGYGKYHDYWRVEDGQWRLHEREVHLFGITLPNH